MVRIHCGGCWGRVGLNCGVFWVKNRGLAWFASRDRMVALWGHNFVNLASVWAVHTFEHLVYLSVCLLWVGCPLYATVWSDWEGGFRVGFASSKLPT